MSTLVTGGAGFIGSEYVRRFLSKHSDERIVVYDAMTYAATESSFAQVRGSVDLVVADCCDLEAAMAAMEKFQVDTIVHFAAESHNSLAVLDPARFFRTNVLGTQTMLEAARRSDIERFHHISTCEVYGDMDFDRDSGFAESDPYRPRTPYNASKAGADHAVRAYSETYGLPVTITNCANNYGPFQFPEKVLPLFIARAMMDAEIPVYRSSHHLREWIHVADHCAAIEAVIERGRVGETYHVGTGEERSVAQIVDVVLAQLEKPRSLIREVEDRPGHDRRYLLDSSKIRSELGWAPTMSFEDGVAATI
ncbi:MAG: dTDP-glucose 4,6-dehydratase, partial [Actinomycetota bacterium]